MRRVTERRKIELTLEVYVDVEEDVSPAIVGGPPDNWAPEERDLIGYNIVEVRVKGWGPVDGEKMMSTAIDEAIQEKI